MSPMQKLKLAKELNALKKKLLTETKPMAKLKLAKEVVQKRKMYFGKSNRVDEVLEELIRKLDIKELLEVDAKHLAEDIDYVEKNIKDANTTLVKRVEELLQFHIDNNKNQVLSDSLIPFSDLPFTTSPRPTEKQKETNNYNKPTITLLGLSIAIENIAGSVRSGRDENGKKWESVMVDHYGYFEGTKGYDGDEVDVFINVDADEKEIEERIAKQKEKEK